MIPTIWHRLDFPCTRQAQEALSLVGHVEDRKQGRHSDRRARIAKLDNRAGDKITLVGILNDHQLHNR